MELHDLLVSSAVFTKGIATLAFNLFSLAYKAGVVRAAADSCRLACLLGPPPASPPPNFRITQLHRLSPISHADLGRRGG